MNSNEIQDYINKLADGWKQERSSSQMTLGKLIRFLEDSKVDTLPSGLTSPDSYRGYYSDLAFEETGKPQKVEELLELCYKALGATFEGYKGGEYLMDTNVPLWIAEYGSCGVKITSINPDGSFITAEHE